MKVLLAGWFSFEEMGATAGDLLSRDLVAGWLEEAGRSYDMAVAPPFAGGVDWRRVDPRQYSTLVFVCGPFGNGPPITEMLPRFSHCRLIGVNLSMLQPLSEWNPFDLLLERDSSDDARPDLSFLSEPSSVPVIGLVQVHPQKEYGERARHEQANAAIRRLLDSRECSVVPIDTRLDENAVGLRTAREVESLIARMDAVVTTRLHGTVLALKNGVPALVIDPIAGGAKLTAQVRTLGWRAAFQADRVDPDELSSALDWCLTEQARTEAGECANRAARALGDAHERFVRELRHDDAPFPDRPPAQ